MIKSVIFWSWFGITLLFGVDVLAVATLNDGPLDPHVSKTQLSGDNSVAQVSTKPKKSRPSVRQSIVLSKKSRKPIPRRALDATPPRIDRLSPTPGRWIVDNLGLREIQIGFTEPVTTPIPTGAITIWTVGAGNVTNFTSSYDVVTYILTVSFASPVRDDRLTVVVDYTVTDIVGNELDGEIADPLSAVLPSGDGVRGGQAVFRINILQGDANRDGVVDGPDGIIIRDALPSVIGGARFDSRADLNVDGIVNAQDVAIFRLAEGRTLPTTDGTPPIVTAIREPSSGLLGSFDRIVIDFNEIISDLRINERTCFLVDGGNNLIVPTSGVGGPFGMTAVYNFVPPLPQCGTYTINISNALADQSGELLIAPTVPPVVTGLIPPPVPTLNAHTTMTTATSVTITGNAPGGTSVETVSPAGTFTAPVSNGTFTIDLPLISDRVSHIFFTTLSTCAGVRSPPTVTSVTHDTEPPHLFIDFPTGAAQITTTTTDVAGRVGDMLSGFMGLQVQLVVNGDMANPIDAIVDVGIGNNGTFFAPSVPLGPIDQPTVIDATATDEMGNSITKQIIVTQVAIPSGTPQMIVVSGNAQTGQMGTVLPSPIVVRMTRADGTPFVNKVVTFDVTRSNGRLGATAAEITPMPGNMDPGSMMFQVRTDANGEARAYWRLGYDAGCGNNRVEVKSMSIAGTVAFCASAAPAPVNQINIGTGNNQRAEAGGPAPEPLRVWVSDACNGVCPVPVTFTVVKGGGKVTGNTSPLPCRESDPVSQPNIVTGQSVTVYTGRTGHAQVDFTLGPDWGNNVVEVRPVANPTMQPARFVIFGLVRDEAVVTSFSGIVLNNASQPIGGATCRLAVGGVFMPDTVTDINGRFQFDNVSGSGKTDLYVDGSGQVHIGGPTCTTPQCDKPPGTFPSLHYETIVVPNAANSLPTPVLLPSLNPNNVKNTYSATPGDPDTILKVEGMEGLKMVVKAGSMTLASGQPAPDGQPIYLNQVHADDIPMPIPDGASPPFSWTLQPSGAMFDPPIQITYPNMSGLPAGSIAYFLSFNHGTSRFEIVATGQVTGDGSRIVSDPGTGLSLAGWGCNCPPYSVTGDCEYDECEGDASGCCYDRCCQGDPCCEDPDPCCNGGGPCCNNPDRCCNPDNPCCGSEDPCCNSNDPCCGNPNRCCNPDNPCCGSDDPCCNSNDPCCGNPDPCCNPDNPCCAAAAVAAVAPADEDDSVASSILLVAADPCCGEGANDPCCNNPDPCCPCNAAGTLCCGDHCCEVECCGEGCCTASEPCCGGTTCCPPERCCGNGECCSQDCEGCLDNGSLSGGMIDVDRDPVCVGDTITFTASGVVDSGGIKRVDCTAKMPIPAVTPNYKWTVTKPDGTTVKGSGSVATILTTKPGTYYIVYTAMAERECPPSDITIGPKMAEAIEPDLDLAGISDEDEENPGGFLCVNDDDDNNNGTPDKDEGSPTAGEDDLRMLTLSVSGATEWKVTLSTSSSKVKVYKAPDRSDPITLPACWATPSEAGCNALADMPMNVWVEGVVASASARDVTLTLKYENGPSTCTDIVKITVVDVDMEIGGIAENAEETLPGLKVATNNDFDEGKLDATGDPVADKADASPLTADGTSIALNGLIACNAFVLPEDDGVLAGSAITITQTGGTGSVRLLAINPAAAAPFNDDWVLVPMGANLRDDFYLSTGVYNTYDSWVEALTPGPVELTLSFIKNGISCEDKVLLNIVEYGEVEIRYKAFIACRAVSTGWLPGITDFFQGDNRNFAYAGSPSRTFQSYHVSVSPKMASGAMTNGVRGSQVSFGTTFGYNDQASNIVTCPSGQVCPSFCTDCIAATAAPECVATAANGANGNTLSAVLTHVSNSISEVQFDLVGGNPCVTAAPAIDAHITFEFRQTCVNGVLSPFEWRIKPGSGSWHDAFPWHELYFNGVQVYIFDPCAAGRTPDPDDLFPPLLGGEDIVILDAMPALGDWQPVP